MSLQPFHLAIPVKDLDETRTFYREIMGCEEGRSSEQWVDFNFFGHQLVIHLSQVLNATIKNHVDGHGVPVPHFGVVLSMEEWEELATRLKAKGVRFEIEPYVRFKGQPGEQATMFFNDPSGNALEFKAFADLSRMFKK
ncbi:VOC family protein [Luteibaculum oceani]|uniref:Glyoxalase n=1 Tax=Luteibaculum oceani TaxID=1294296 RepID=A0A5C6VKK7_9FLAO|nr:VOC family protein [Luteibaculum oceani]TXC85251.1 glyoxalase [Luteibaculum oceani]